MSVNPDTVRADGPAIPARPLVVSRSRTARRIVLDRWASRLVISGGIIIIAAILAILVVIASEVYPLFKQPTVMFLGAYPTPVGRAIGSSPAPGSSVGVDEYREVAFEVSGAGVLEFTAAQGNTESALGAGSRPGGGPGDRNGGLRQGALCHRHL